MHYLVEVLNYTMERVAYLTGLVHAKLSERMNGHGILTIESTEPRDWEYLIPGTTFLKVTSNDGHSLGIHRIIEVSKSRMGERTAIHVTSRHTLADTCSELFADAVNCINCTPLDLISKVLGYSKFSPGTIEPDRMIPFIRFEYETIHNCLLRICNLTGGELSLNDATGEISLLNSIGVSNGAYIRYGINLCGISRSISVSTMANRIWGIGGGDPPLSLQQAPTGDGNGYVEDSDSISSYGIIEDVYNEPTLEYIDNLVATPALDGVYTNGLCENWTSIGTPVLSINTNTEHILYGKYSQHIQTTTDASGITQTISVEPSAVYSLSANIFLIDGSVRVQVSDGTALYRRESPVTGTGYISVRIENWKALNNSVAISIFQEGSGTADFYVDSVQLTSGAHTLPFTVGNSADYLYKNALAHLQTRKEPSITYGIDLIHLHEYQVETSMTFGLGDTVTIQDPTLGIDISTRVMERTIDLIHPHNMSVRLDNASKTLADILKSIRQEQEKGIRLQRTAFAESSKAAEEGSVRLGFANNAFRFYGFITPSAWNGFTWTAGILRVGIGYYSITAGSLGGISSQTTAYVYFDRTNPSTFGMTTEINQAENDDRILIFTVTTTVSPELCGIHPLGIIHD